MHERRTFFSESTHEREKERDEIRVIPRVAYIKRKKKSKKKMKERKKKIIIRVLADLLYTTILLRNR